MRQERSWVGVQIREDGVGGRRDICTEPSVGLTEARFWVMGGVVMILSEGIFVQWFV